MSNIPDSDVRIIRNTAARTAAYGERPVSLPFAAENYKEMLARLGEFAGGIVELLDELLERRDSA